CRADGACTWAGLDGPRRLERGCDGTDFVVFGERYRDRSDGRRCSGGAGRPQKREHERGAHDGVELLRVLLLQQCASGAVCAGLLRAELPEGEHRGVRRGGGASRDGERGAETGRCLADGDSGGGGHAGGELDFAAWYGDRREG